MAKNYDVVKTTHCPNLEKVEKVSVIRAYSNGKPSVEFNELSKQYDNLNVKITLELVDDSLELRAIRKAKDFYDKYPDRGMKKPSDCSDSTEYIGGALRSLAANHAVTLKRDTDVKKALEDATDLDDKKRNDIIQTAEVLQEYLRQYSKGKKGFGGDKEKLYLVTKDYINRPETKFKDIDEIFKENGYVPSSMFPEGERSLREAYCIYKHYPYTSQGDYDVYDWKCPNCETTGRSLFTTKCRECGRDVTVTGILNGPLVPRNVEDRKGLEELRQKIDEGLKNKIPRSEFESIRKDFTDYKAAVFNRFYAGFEENIIIDDAEPVQEETAPVVQYVRRPSDTLVQREEFQANGDRYFGMFAMRKLSGNGRIEYKNGKIYIGEIENGTPSGKGKLIDGERTYTGTFSDGMLEDTEGSLEVVGSSPFTYKGNFHMGVPVGEGTYTKNGVIYKGHFIRNSITSEDAEVIRDGEWHYYGGVRNGMRHGEGRLEFEKNENRNESAGRKRRRPRRNNKDLDGFDAEWAFDHIVKADVGKDAWMNGTFTGPWANSKPQGEGTYESENERYVGHFVDGVFSGEGVYDSGRTHLDGEWRFGKIWNTRAESGSGMKSCDFLRNGSFFMGSWEEGVPVKGTVETVEGDRYTGPLKNERYHGKQGTMTWKDGGSWVGEWRDGYPYEGDGTARILKGRDKPSDPDDAPQRDETDAVAEEIMPETHLGSFTGHIKGFKPYDNKGIRTYNDGTVIYGSFTDLEPSAITKMIYPDGTVYEGDMTPNKERNGQGTLTYGNTVYKGEFKNNKKDGKGKEIVDGKVVYDGEWKNDLQHGFGTCYYPDGTTYVGYWALGKRNGPGMLYGKDKIRTQRGTWVNDEFKFSSQGPDSIPKTIEKKGRFRRDNYWDRGASQPWNWAALGALVPGLGQFLRGSIIPAIIIFAVFAILMAIGLVRFNDGFHGINYIIAAIIVYTLSFVECQIYARTGKRIF